jgi:hypothetical protein
VKQQILYFVKKNNSGIFADDVFLLRFLRARKYSILKARKSLESYLSGPQVHPAYLKSLNVMDPKLSALFDTGYTLLSPEADADGCRIKINRPGVIDTETFTGLDLARATFTLNECISDLEEVQISGIKIIFDFSETHLNFFSLFSFNDYKNFIEIAKNITPHRVKALYVLNLPPFANYIGEFFMKLLNKKMRERVIVLKDANELKNYVEPNLLPKEYNGNISMDDYIKYVKDFLFQNRQNVLIASEREIDLVDECSRVASRNDEKLSFGAEGSFRKLEID